MSEVEELFLRLQKQTGGNLLWGDLQPEIQVQFVAAVRFILQVTATTKG